jgi:hypothetical protein
MQVRQHKYLSKRQIWVLSAHEAKSSLRYRLLRDELAGLRKNIEFLTSKEIDVAAVNRFEQRYREQIADRHGRITPPNFDDARKLPIDSIYVVPNFSPPYNWNPRDVKFAVSEYRAMFDKLAGSAKFLPVCIQISKSRARRSPLIY